MAGYPDLETFAYTFDRAELSLNRKIYTAVINVEFDQPTTEGAVMGTRPYPLKRTAGSMDLGEGMIRFSDEAERFLFLNDLGNAWREQKWTLTWILKAQGATSQKLACFGCRVLSNPVAHERGEDALGGELPFSFMYHTINGRTPHSGMPTNG